jgi:hypothetical protein
MKYYRSSSGGVYKVYACNPDTGRSTLILNYKSLGMYNVINQNLSTIPISGLGLSDYDLHISGLTECQKSDFSALAAQAKTFIDSLL